MVAMVNKSLLPVRLQLPFLGEVVFLTRGLKYNIELLLFCKKLLCLLISCCSLWVFNV
jgi:Autophagy protein Apg9.